MSKFLDRLEQINLGTTATMGFGVSRTQKPPGMALVGLVSGGHAKGIQSLAKAGPDAALVSGLDDPAAVQELANGLGGETPWGVRLPSLNEEQAQALEEGGCDLVALSLQGTTVAAAASENMARVLCVGLDVEADQLPAIGALPVDALLLPMGDVAAPWTLQDLAAIAKFSRRVSQYILVEVSQPPGQKELEALRNVGVHGLVLDVAAVKAKELAALKDALQEMPARSPSAGTAPRPWCPRQRSPAASPLNQGNRGPSVATGDRPNSEGLDLEGLVLPDQGIIELADKLTGYMTEIQLGGVPDVIGQVLDDFLEQCGSMPEDLTEPEAFDEITRNQLAVTLAYQLGRLEGRSPQVVRRLVQQALKKWGSSPVDPSPDISDDDLESPKEMVYPRLRRLEYVSPEDEPPLPHGR